MNYSFSTQLPTLQLIVDQTSLGLFKECPRKYFYRMIEGWTSRSSNVHLSFGGWFHEACDKYERAKALGAEHQEALRAAIRHAMAATWDSAIGKPWNSENKDKNRYTLIRSIVWYLDVYGKSNRFPTIILSNGQPAVELTFKYIPRNYENGEELKSNITGEPIFFSGHLDLMLEMEEMPFISDKKTTSRRLGPEYFAAYTPDNQFSMYSHAGKWAFGVPVAGVICDAVQVGQTFCRFERQIIYRTEPQLREWYADTRFWLRLMGEMAESNRWPQNDKSCFNCLYRPVCARPSSARQKWLEADYVREQWDPSLRRGD